MMLLRARTLAMGYSGARPEVAETIVALLNAGLRRWCRSTARSAQAATWHHSRTARCR